MNTTRNRDVQGFLKQVKKNEQLRKQMQQIKKTNRQESLAEIVKIADAAGFKFTAQDYEETARAQLAGTGNVNQLTEEQLISVAM